MKRVYGGVKRRSGTARMRGRTTRKKVGPLIVVSNDRGVGKAAASIPGVEVASSVDSTEGVLPLAPGGRRGKAHPLDDLRRLDAFWSRRSATRRRE